MTNKVLGRGLSSLMNNNQINLLQASEQTKMLNVDLLIPDRYQPRKHFDQEALQELSESINKSGIIQPIIVRKVGSQYTIIAGERRWRAAKLCRLHEVPVIEKQISDQEALEFAIVENVQRKDLTPIEESEGYIQLAEEFGYTQEEIGKIVGKSRGHITNMMRLNSLPDLIKHMVNEQQLSMGHARTLIGMDTIEALEIADTIIKKNLNVRQTENLVANKKRGKELFDAGIKSTAQLIKEDSENKNHAEIFSLQQSISELLGIDVSIKHTNNKGTIMLKFRDFAELDLILQKLTA